MQHAIADVDRTTRETTLDQQLEIGADAVGQEALSASDHDRHEEQVAFVDQAGAKRVACELRPADADVTGRRLLQTPDRLRVEVALDARPRARDRRQRPRIDDLVGSAPYAGEIA